jgi:tetratricopeptide (TPR) repeat protein
MGDLFDSIEKRLGGAFTRCFSLRRTIAEIEARGADVLVAARRDEEDLEGELGPALGRLSLELQEKEWKGVVHQSISFSPEKGLAVCTCLVKVKEPRNYCHLRFWLIKEAEGWGIYDFEDLDNANRLSRLVGGDAKNGNPVQVALRLDEARNLYLKGKGAMDSGQVAPALDLMQQAYKAAFGTALEAVSGRQVADLLSQMHRDDEALQIYNTLLKSKKGIPGALVGKGVLLDRLGKKVEALIAFEEALSAVGEDPAILSNIGRLRDEVGKPKEASEVYNRAAKLVGEDPDLAIDLGYLLLRRGTRSEAGPLLLAAATNGEEYFVRAAAQLSEARAIPEMKQLLASNKENLFAPMLLPLYRGALLRWEGRPEEAESTLKKGMLDAVPEVLPFFRYELALALAQAKKTEESLALISEVKATKGWTAKARLLRACVIAETSSDEAWKELSLALQEKPVLLTTVDNEAMLASLRANPEVKKTLEELRPHVGLK